MSIAWVFPGQGSQKLGMADALMDLPSAKERFALASEIIGRNLFDICRGESTESGYLGDINDTRNTQPALFVVESLLVDELIRQGRKPELVAGHSLGEIVALYTSKVFDCSTALNLLKSRSELMAAAGGGAMTAILGFDRNQLEKLVQGTEGIVIANDNSSSQVVLSGLPEVVSEITKQIVCKRAISLQVSGAFHSPLMQEASDKFALELDKIVFKNATIPVISNADPSPCCDSKLLKNRLKDQMTNGVRWRETMNVMLDEGVSTLIEIGPGNVLGGLAKRSLSGVNIAHIASINDF